MEWISEYRESLPDAQAIVVVKEEGIGQEFTMELGRLRRKGHPTPPPASTTPPPPTLPQYDHWSQAFLTLPAGLGSTASAVEPNKYRAVMGV